MNGVPMLGPKLVEYFLNAAESWVCDRYAMDLRYIAWREGDSWNLVEGSLVFWPLPHAEDHGFSIATPTLLAGQILAFPVTKHEAIDVLQKATRGHLDVNGERLTLPGSGDLDYYSEMHHRDRWFCPLHLRVASKNTVTNFSYASLAAVDASLRCEQTPFDGTADLASWLGLNANFSGIPAPALTLSIAPPIDLVYDETTLDSNLLSATLHAHPTLDVRGVYLAVRPAPGDGPYSRRQVADQIVWSEPEGLKRVGKLTVKVGNSDSVLTMLSLGAETIRRQWIVDPKKARNSRYIAVNQFDQDLRMLRQALFDSQDGRKFEQAVAALLFLLGFSPALPLETDSPDIVVVTPAGQLIVVECTIRLADFASKLGRLIERRAALSKSLADTKLPSVVTAALVCRLRREEIAVNDTELRDRRVLLFSAEDIEAGLMRSRLVLNADALLQEATAAAPPNH